MPLKIVPKGWTSLWEQMVQSDWSEDFHRGGI